MTNPDKVFEDIQHIINVLYANSLKKNYDFVSYNKELSKLKELFNYLRFNFSLYYSEQAICNNLIQDSLDSGFNHKTVEFLKIRRESLSYNPKAPRRRNDWYYSLTNNPDFDFENYLPNPEADKLVWESYRPENVYNQELNAFMFKLLKPVEEGTRNWGEFSCRVWSYYFFFIYCIGTIIYKTPFPLSTIYKVTLVEPFKYIDHPMLKTSKEFGTPRQFFTKIWGISLYNSYMSILREESYFENKVLDSNCEIHLESLKVASFLLHINGFEEASLLAKEVFLDTNI